MPIGAIIGGVGALASIGGAIIGSNSTKKAAKTAADTATANTAANNALAREIYNQNRGVLAPYINRGNAAGGVLARYLGLPANDTSLPAYQPLSGQGALSNPNGYPTTVPPDWEPRYPGELHYTQEPAYQASLTSWNGSDGYMRGDVNVPISQQTVFDNYGNPVANPVSGGDPFRTYIDSSDYAFREGEGGRSLNHLSASRGALNSGAAMKELQRYKQNLQQGYRGEYFNLLGQQQGMGLSAGSALAGVGTNYAGMVTANNNSAAETAINAAMMRANANNQMWSGIANGIGGFAGSAFGGGWWK